MLSQDTFVFGRAQHAPMLQAVAPESSTSLDGTCRSELYAVVLDGHNFNAFRGNLKHPRLELHVAVKGS